MSTTDKPLCVADQQNAAYAEDVRLRTAALREEAADLERRVADEERRQAGRVPHDERHLALVSVDGGVDLLAHGPLAFCENAARTYLGRNEVQSDATVYFVKVLHTMDVSEFVLGAPGAVTAGLTS